VLNNFLLWIDGFLGSAAYFPFILLGVGLFFTLYLGFPQVRYFRHAWRVLAGKFDKKDSQGDTSHFEALSTALSGTVGTGNIGGVALAIFLGGPAAIFWMWMTAFLGMTTKFVEVTLSHKYRVKTEDGTMAGGPMYYMDRRLNMKWLAVIFAIATIISSFGTGNMPQINNIAQSMEQTFEIDPIWTGAILSILLAMVIIGGIKRIAAVTSKIVPIMGILYVIGSLSVIFFNIDNIGESFVSIFRDAFTGSAAAGGFLGASFAYAFNRGVNRGLFSNEAGQGSAPIAHAAAQTKNPVMQGEIAMIGVFIDTIIICTMTALVILTVQGDFKKSPALMAANACFDAGIEMPVNPGATDGAKYGVGDLFPSAYEDGREAKIAAVGPTAQSYLLACQASGQVEVNQQALDASGNPEVLMDVDHAWETDANSAAVTTRAYAAAIPVVGPWIVPVALFFFAFTTIIGWSYYGEQAVTYLIGEWATHPFRYIWVVVVFLGSVAAADWLWLLGDIANASMAFPNLIAILALSGVVAAMHKSNGDPDKGHPVHDYREEERHPEKE